MKTYFASGFWELEVMWRWFGGAGLLIISMGFYNPYIGTNADWGGKAAPSITSAGANEVLQQSTALGEQSSFLRGATASETGQAQRVLLHGVTSGW